MFRSFLLFAALFLTACATPYGLYADKRPLEVIRDDASIRSNIENKLRVEGYTGVNELSVHVYYGRVFLAGELPENQYAKATRAAEQVNGVHTVVMHRFVPLKAQAEADAALKLRLEKNLIGAEGVTSSRIDYVVNAGRVVLLGVVGSEAEKEAAVRAARATKDVRGVTSYLFIRDDSPPQR